MVTWSRTHKSGRGTPASRPLKAAATTRETRINVDQEIEHENSDHPIPTIFKVPKHIREVNPKAYDPVVASIGPFHHCPSCWSSVMHDSKAHKPVAASCGHFDSTSAMQKYKWRCVWYLLSRGGDDRERVNQLFEKCLVKLEEKNDEVRRCYSEELPPSMDDRKLASIMLLDGCFIIYIILKNKKLLKDAVGKEMIQCTIETEKGNVVLNIKEKDKLLVAGLFTFDLVVYDLLKLENQIPFFIIELLFDQLKPCGVEKIDLVDLALQLFKGIHPEESESFKKKKEKSPGEYHHLLHLFYSSRIPSPDRPGCIHDGVECIESKWMKAKAAIDRKISKWKRANMSVEKKEDDTAPQPTPTSKLRWIPSAVELDRAGVKFQKNEQLPDSFLNITFDSTRKKFMPLLRSGRMKIPPLQMDDSAGALFHNLVALEQCYPFTLMYITIYAIFMNCIIDEAEDVRLLQSAGILDHGLGNNQAVADFFNQLDCQIYFSLEKNYLKSQIAEIKEFYNFKWNRLLADLRRDYFRNPWTTISVLAAIFLLLLTVEQAVFSALSYVRSL